MLFLGQGHRDAQTFVPKELSELSLTPTSSGADHVDLPGQQLFPPGNTRKKGLRENACLVVVVVVVVVVVCC